ERVAHIFVELVDRGRLTGIELAGHAAVQDGQRRRADVLGQLEVFVKAQAKGLEVVGSGPKVEFVVPAIDEGSPFRNIAHRGLPAIARRQQAAFDDAASGEAKKAGVQIVEQLDQVFAQSVRAVLPSVHGEERHHVKIELPYFVNEERYSCVLHGSVRSNDGFISFPRPVEAFEFSASDFVTAFIREGGADGFRPAAAHISGESVFAGAFYSDAAITGVPECVPRLVDADPEIVWIRLVERIVGTNAEFTLRAIEAFTAEAHHLMPAGQRLLELERPILDELRIESAIGSEVDVFKKNAEHRGRDRGPRMRSIDGDDGRTLLVLA